MQTRNEITQEFMKLAMELIGPGPDYFPIVIQVKKEFGLDNMTPIKQVNMLWRVKEIVESLYKETPRPEPRGKSINHNNKEISI